MSNERRALYPGSFDPPTNGHSWVMEKVSEEFDKGIVAVGHNPDKPGRFPLNERLEMLGEVAEEYPNLAITSFHGLYQADFAEMMGANVIVRGLRNTEYFPENDVRQVNRVINPNVETIFRMPPNELQQVSSSMVMGLVGFEGWEGQVQPMVPTLVFDRIKRRQTEHQREKMQGKWNALHGTLGASGNPTKQFEDIYQRYTEPHRAYHDITHLSTCLNELDLVKSKVERPDEIALALWFHDAIQDASLPQNPENPVKHDDEVSCATLARDVIEHSMFLPTDTADQVANLILATKHTGKTENDDERYMVDIDLAILGRSSRLFDEYETKVRQEYAWVDEELFREKRADILETFLPPHRLHIYQTPFFQDRYEQQATRNLNRSIAQLRSM